MAGLSRPNFNARERPMSLDQDRQAQLTARDLLDAYLLNMDARLFGGTTFPGALELPRNTVLGGLGLVDASPNIAIGPGSLLQFSTTLVPTPGALDSPYRLGHLRTPASLPIPGATAFYLVEAQVSEQVTASESRDVMNAITGDFVPTLLPKITEALLTFQILTGTATAFPAPSGGDWVVIGGFFASGGSVFNIAAQFTGLFDMRPLPPVGIERKVFKNGYLTQRNYVSEQWDGITPVDRFTSFDVEGFNGAAHVWFRNPAPTLVNFAMLTTGFGFGGVNDPVNPASAVADGDWFYLYLCPWNGYHPTGQPFIFFDPGSASLKTFNGGFSRGILVASSVPPPVQGDTTNGATLNLPNPFSGTVAIGDATLVGAFCRAGAAGVLSCQAAGNRVMLAEEGGARTRNFFTSANITLGSVQTSTIPANMLPISARAARIQGALFTDPTNVGGSAGFALYGQSVSSRLVGAALNSLSGGLTFEVEFPMVKFGGAFPGVRWQGNAPGADKLGLDLWAAGFHEGVC